MKFLKKLWVAFAMIVIILPVTLTETFIKELINTWKCSYILDKVCREFERWKKIFKLNVLDKE